MTLTDRLRESLAAALMQGSPLAAVPVEDVREVIVVLAPVAPVEFEYTEADAIEDKELYDSMMQAQFAGYFLREVERRAGASVGGIRAWLAEKNCDCGGCKMLAAILGAEGER